MSKVSCAGVRHKFSAVCASCRQDGSPKVRPRAVSPDIRGNSLNFAETAFAALAPPARVACAVAIKNSIKLNSGTVLHPDIIVTTTGLKLSFGGGMEITVDGQHFDQSKQFLWKGTMLQDVPNLFFTIGFENASWTLGCDCAAHLTVRVIEQLRNKGFKAAVPRMDAEDQKTMVPKSLFSLKATYLDNVNEKLPKGSSGV